MGRLTDFFLVAAKVRRHRQFGSFGEVFGDYCQYDLMVF